MILIETKKEIKVSITTETTSGTILLVAMAQKFREYLEAFQPKDPFINIAPLGRIEVKSAIELCDFLLKVDLSSNPKRTNIDCQEYPHIYRPT